MMALMISLAAVALPLIGRKKHIADTVKTGFGQRNSQVAFGRLAQEFMRQSRQNAGTVSGVRLAAACTAMIHVPQDAVSIVDNLP